MDSLNDSDVFTIKKYSHSDKKKLLNRINDLKNKKCNMKIFKIIYTDNVDYSKNNNGVFFNLNQLNDESLSKIDNIISYYENKHNKNITTIYSKVEYNYTESSDIRDNINQNNIIITRPTNNVYNVYGDHN